MLEALGGHFWHPDRNRYNRRGCTVELLYLHDATSGFDFDSAASRIKLANDRGIDTWLRIDWKPHKVFPDENDENGVFDYVQGCQQAAAQLKLRGIISGNEFNWTAETGGIACPPWWAARIVYGHRLDPSRTDCVYQFAKTADPNIRIVMGAVAPYAGVPNIHVDGDNHGLIVPDNRSDTIMSERYQYTLSRYSYDNWGHVPEIGEVQFAAHVYGRIGSGSENGGALEPRRNVRGVAGAQMGTRWFQDFLWYCREGQRNSPYGTDWAPPVLISEANTLHDGIGPRTNYQTGWWKECIYYVRQFQNVMGACVFVDQNYGGNWEETCVTINQGRTGLWNTDHDELLRIGW
jgi:hypothetical protein